MTPSSLLGYTVPEVNLFMSKKWTSNQKAWLIGIGMATALWLFVACFADVYFPTNDDKFLLRTFTGESPDGVPSFHIIIHGMYVYPLMWLNRLVPDFAWISVLEIVLMWLSTAVILKSMILCFERDERAHSLLYGCFAAICYALMFLFYLCARPTFSTITATLGAAAAAHILSMNSVEKTDGQIYRSMLFGLLLVVLGYGLREEVLLPALGFCGIAFLYQFVSFFGWGKNQRRSIRPLLCVALTVVLAAGGLVFGRQAEIRLRGQQEYYDWHMARSNVMDFLTIDELSEESTEAVGWTRTQTALLDAWYTMEEDFSTEAFTYISSQEENQQTRKTPGASLWDFRTRAPLIFLSIIILFVIGVGCLAGLALKRKGLWVFLTLMAAAAGFFAMFVWLAIQGRLLYRVVMIPLLPAAALVFCLIPKCMPKQRWFTPLFCILLAAGTALYTIPTAQAVKHREVKWDYDTYEAMDQIALDNPDLLFIYSQELVNDTRLFPDFSNGVPYNLMFWGGWQRGSPEYAAKLEAFGIDSEHFTPKDWLRPELRYLTLEDEPHPLLVQHLTEQLGDNLRWEQIPMDIALKAYRFYCE